MSIKAPIAPPPLSEEEVPLLPIMFLPGKDEGPS